MSRPGRFTMAIPMTTAEMSPVSSRSASQAAATPITAAICADVASSSFSRTWRSSSHSTPTPIAPPTAPTAALAANCSNWLPKPLSSPATTAWKTSAPRMPPTGSIREPSQTRMRCSRSEGRTKLSSGPTTVGPDTTRIAPSITAAPLDMSSTGTANSAPASAR